MDPLGQFMAAGRPNLVLGHQMPASNALGQPSYTTAEERAKKKKLRQHYMTSKLALKEVHYKRTN